MRRADAPARRRPPPWCCRRLRPQVQDVVRLCAARAGSVRAARPRHRAVGRRAAGRRRHRHRAVAAEPRLDVDIPNRRVTVEPGVTNLEITRQVAPFGYYYAPDPSSQQVCSIGGNVAENSGGAHCLKYGFTVHHVLAADVGAAVGRARSDRRPVRRRAGPDLLGLLIGSEGTLAIVDQRHRPDPAQAGEPCRRCWPRSTRSTRAAPRCRTSSAPASFPRRSR